MQDTCTSYPKLLHTKGDGLILTTLKNKNILSYNGEDHYRGTPPHIALKLSIPANSTIYIDTKPSVPLLNSRTNYNIILYGEDPTKGTSSIELSSISVNPHIHFDRISKTSVLPKVQ